MDKNPLNFPPRTQNHKTIEELERKAMKYEFLMEREMNKYFRNTKNKEAFNTALRASREANKIWKKIAFLERITKFPIP